MRNLNTYCKSTNTYMIIAPTNTLSFMYHQTITNLYTQSIINVTINNNENIVDCKCCLSDIISLYNSFPLYSREKPSLSDFLVIKVLIDLRLDNNDYTDRISLNKFKLEVFHRNMAFYGIYYCPVLLLLSKGEDISVYELLNIERSKSASYTTTDKDIKYTDSSNLSTNINHIQYQIIASTYFHNDDRKTIALFTELTKSVNFKFSKWSCIFALYYMQSNSPIHELLNKFEPKWLSIKDHLYDISHLIYVSNMVSYVVKGFF